jgi:sugar lactone lactonase YvrE
VDVSIEPDGGEDSSIGADVGADTSPMAEAGADSSTQADAGAPDATLDAPVTDSSGPPPPDAAACEDAGGHCEIILSEPAVEATWLTLDSTSTYVYFTTQGSISSSIPGAVSRVPVNGGPTTVLAMGGIPMGVVVDSANVYWADYGQSQILVAALDGVADAGAGTVFAPNESGAENLAIDANNLYWITITGEVRQKSLTGSGAATTIGTAIEPGGLALYGSNVYFTDFNNGMAAGGAVYSVPIGGSTRTTLATGLTSPQSVFVDASGIYVGTSDSVLLIPLAGLPDGGSPTVIASGQGYIGGVVVAGSTVYWTDESAAGSLDSAPTSGAGPVTPLLSGLYQPLGLAVDSRNLYFCELSPSGFVAQLSR